MPVKKQNKEPKHIISQDKFTDTLNTIYEKTIG